MVGSGVDCCIIRGGKRRETCQCVLCMSLHTILKGKGDSENPGRGDGKRFKDQSIEGNPPLFIGRRVHVSTNGRHYWMRLTSSPLRSFNFVAQTVWARPHIWIIVHIPLQTCCFWKMQAVAGQCGFVELRLSEDFFTTSVVSPLTIPRYWCRCHNISVTIWRTRLNCGNANLRRCTSWVLTMLRMT